MKQAALGLTALLLLVAGRVADGGPMEARRLWKDARDLVGAPWPRRVAAHRKVVDAAHPSDRYHRRALDALAALLQASDLVHGANAWRARSAHLGPARERRRLQALLTLTRALRRDGDLEAAPAPLLEVADLARAEAPWLADGALLDLTKDATGRGDREATADLVRRMREEDAAPDIRLRALDLLGVLHLDRGDARNAGRVLREAERVYAKAIRQDDATVARCAKIWLDLELRARLREAEGNDRR